MYAQQQAEGAAAAVRRSRDAGGEAAGKKDEGDVVDAEFTEVKDKK
jgi:molecular chaperone DnaK